MTKKFTLDGGSLDHENEESQAGFDFSPYKRVITVAIMSALSDDLGTYQNYLEDAMRNDDKDERHSPLIFHWHKRIGEIIEKQNAALDAIDALCARKEQG